MRHRGQVCLNRCRCELEALLSVNATGHLRKLPNIPTGHYLPSSSSTLSSPRGVLRPYPLVLGTVQECSAWQCCRVREVVRDNIASYPYGGR